MVKNKPNISVIIQARMASTRLPGKVMMDLCGKTVLTRVIERVKGAKRVGSICVATSKNAIDDIVLTEAEKNKVMIFRGSENDVLSRYCEAALKLRSDIVVRVTADNPLTDPFFIDLCADKIISGNLDFASMVNVPYGSGVEAIRKDALLAISKIARQSDDREHVTAYLYKNKEKFNICFIEPEQDLRRPDIRVTLDTIDDYHLLQSLFNNFMRIPTDEIKLRSVIDLIDSMRMR